MIKELVEFQRVCKDKGFSGEFSLDLPEDTYLGVYSEAQGSSIPRTESGLATNAVPTTIQLYLPRGKVEISSKDCFKKQMQRQKVIKKYLSPALAN